MKVKVFNKEGKETGREIELSDEIFGIEPNDHVMWLAVRQLQAHNRQGTHKSKERNEIARSGKKAFRQKGTGGARRGDMRSPLLKGGGRAFGPKPHAYTLKLNKKVKDLAKKSALSYKAKAGNILVLETFQLAAPKTKDFLSLLTNLNIAGNKSLVLLGEQNQNLALSARNLPYINLTDAKLLNTFDVMKAQKIVLTEDAVKVIEENFSNN
jgi:large subunit ribosomal protein L4